MIISTRFLSTTFPLADLRVGHSRHKHSYLQGEIWPRSPGTQQLRQWQKRKSSIQARNVSQLALDLIWTIKDQCHRASPLFQRDAWLALVWDESIDCIYSIFQDVKVLPKNHSKSCWYKWQRSKTLQQKKCVCACVYIRTHKHAIFILIKNEN